eukprot:6186729-Pleurochrysis_carterae.AAC.1
MGGVLYFACRAARMSRAYDARQRPLRRPFWLDMLSSRSVSRHRARVQPCAQLSSVGMYVPFHATVCETCLTAYRPSLCGSGSDII